MKKIIALIILTLLLSACGKTNNNETTKINNQEINKKLSTNTPLLDVKEKTKQTEQVLKKAWLTWEKLKKELEEQKAWWEKIANLTWDARKKYVLETEILPKIIKSSKVSSKCKTTNLDNYTLCLYANKTPIKKLLDQVPASLQDAVKKSYYHNIYANHKKELFKKIDDAIAIEQKKDILYQLYFNHILKSNMCSRFPEQETKTYCESLFK